MSRFFAHKLYVRKNSTIMNAAQAHLALNHLPVFATVFGMISILIGLILRNHGVKNLGLVFLILAGITAIPAVSSGEEAEEIVEKMNIEDGIHDIIHEHEEKGEGARTLALILGALAIVALWANLKKRSFAQLLSLIVLAGSIGSAGYMLIAAKTGGEIRHPEIRDGFKQEAGEHDHSEYDGD